MWSTLLLWRHEGNSRRKLSPIGDLRLLNELYPTMAGIHKTRQQLKVYKNVFEWWDIVGGSIGDFLGIARGDNNCKPIWASCQIESFKTVCLLKTTHFASDLQRWTIIGANFPRVVSSHTLFCASNNRFAASWCIREDNLVKLIRDSEQLGPGWWRTSEKCLLAINRKRKNGES